MPALSGPWKLWVVVLGSSTVTEGYGFKISSLHFPHSASPKHRTCNIRGNFDFQTSSLNPPMLSLLPLPRFTFDYSGTSKQSVSKCRTLSKRGTKRGIAWTSSWNWEEGSRKHVLGHIKWHARLSWMASRSKHQEQSLRNWYPARGRWRLDQDLEIALGWVEAGWQVPWKCNCAKESWREMHIKSAENSPQRSVLTRNNYTKPHRFSNSGDSTALETWRIGTVNDVNVSLKLSQSGSLSFVLVFGVFSWSASALFNRRRIDLKYLIYIYRINLNSPDGQMIFSHELSIHSRAATSFGLRGSTCMQLNSSPFLDNFQN
jgi:hypothetical protein